MKYTVRIGKDALTQQEDITDRRIRQEIFDRIKELANNPEQQGKPLKNELAGPRSVRVAHQRFRIIYELQREQILVIVVAVGLRKEGDRADIYRKTAVLNRTYNRFWRK